MDFPGGSDGKASIYHAGDLGFILGSEKSTGERNGNPLQYSCLENPMDRGAWWATVRGVTKSRTRLSDSTTTTELSYTLKILLHLGLARDLIKKLSAEKLMLLNYDVEEDS